MKLPENVATSDIRIYHFGYDLRAEKMNEKFKRSIKEKSIEDLKESADEIKSFQETIRDNLNDENIRVMNYRTRDGLIGYYT